MSKNHLTGFVLAVVIPVALLGACEKKNQPQYSTRSAIVEALALTVVAAEAVKVDGHWVCKYAVLAGSPLAAAWQKICSKDKPAIELTGNCIGAWLGCVRKEGMADASGRMPEGGSLDCDNKRDKCVNQ
jgi:hypothetical protein